MVADVSLRHRISQFNFRVFLIFYIWLLGLDSNGYFHPVLSLRPRIFRFSDSSMIWTVLQIGRMTNECKAHTLLAHQPRYFDIIIGQYAPVGSMQKVTQRNVSLQSSSGHKSLSLAKVNVTLGTFILRTNVRRKIRLHSHEYRVVPASHVLKIWSSVLHSCMKLDRSLGKKLCRYSSGTFDLYPCLQTKSAAKQAKLEEMLRNVNSTPWVVFWMG